MNTKTKIVLILSVEEDQSTMNVIEWLVLMNQPFVLLHPDDLINFSFNNKKYYIEVNNRKLNLDDIKSFWYRRGFITLKKIQNTKKELDWIVLDENKSILDFLYFLLENKLHINKRSDNSINKLTTLIIAEKCGLLIPKSYYNSSEFGKEKKITKTIVGSASFIKDNKVYMMFTKTISNKELTENYEFKYTQERILKKYELRIFYLHDKLWSMAIFSQKDNQTKVDFREYNLIKPNRNVPYSLPNHIEKKIKNLMKTLDINSGSIDMIVSKENKYIFLEVNPIGQFGMTSYPCNYKIEKEIAKYLIHEK